MSTLSHESLRLAALTKFKVLDSFAEEEFDDIAWLASHICGTPIAIISLVDAERTWFKSEVGMSGVKETARDVSFCGHTILTDDLFEIPNALDDARFRENPLVTGSPGIRFYAGMPLVTHDGHNIGSICVIDQVPRQLGAQQCAALKVLARQVIRQLENRNAAQKQDELQFQRDRFFSLSLDMLAIAGMDGYFKSVNPAFLEVLGYPLKEILARPFLDFVHPQDHAATLLQVEKLGRGERIVEFENRYQKSDGKWLYLSWKAHPVTNEKLIYATARDITARKLLDLERLKNLAQ